MVEWSQEDMVVDWSHPVLSTCGQAPEAAIEAKVVLQVGEHLEEEEGEYSANYFRSASHSII